MYAFATTEVPISVLKSCSVYCVQKSVCEQYYIQIHTTYKSHHTGYLGMSY